MRHDGPKRARSRKRRTQAKESLKCIGSPLLGRPALLLAQVLTVTGQTAWSELAAGLPGNASCADLVDAYGRQHGVGQPMAELAALFHRFQPNIRLL